jgi:hypothetical protein
MFSRISTVYGLKIARQKENGKARRKEQMMLKYEECGA